MNIILKKYGLIIFSVLLFIIYLINPLQIFVSGNELTFFSIIIAGTLKHGFIGHWKNMIPGGLPAPVLLILIPVEIMGMFIKPLALLLRLGANMTAGHIGMVAIFGLPSLIFGSMNSEGMGFGVGFFSVMLNTALYFLEMIVCMVQAYVFALLSSVFIGMAIHAEH